MQLDELYTEIDDEIGLVIDDYLPGDCSATDTHRLMAQLDDESVLDLRKCAVALSPCGAPEDLDQSMSPRGMRLLARVTGLNDETAIAMSNYFGELTKVQGATLSDLLVVPGVTTVQAQAIKDTLARVVEATIMVQYNWVLGLSHHRSGSLPDWVLAIDFGTSFTVAAAKVDGRPAEVIEIAGERRMPSVVLIDAETVMVGRVAEDLSGTNPKRVVRALKNRLGDQAPLILDGRPHQVVALVAIVLRHVYDEAVSQLHRSPSEVRLTHPATWNRPRLNRLLEAAAKAGLPNPVLVPEPVAAALSFASEMGIAAGACIAVYDLGGGTFDSAVVTSSAGGFQVIGRPGGDQHIGGELFDEILVNRLGERLAPADWTALQTDADPVWQRVASTLRNEARRAKETLSVSTYADLIVPLPAGLMEVRVQRQEYEDLIRPYIAETVVLLERCVAEAGIDSRRLAGISLAGGASRTPMVETQVTEAFRAVPLIRRADPKAAVAIGATAFDRPATQPRPSLGNRTTQGAANTPPGPLSTPPPPTAGATSPPPPPPPPPPPSAAHPMSVPQPRPPSPTSATTPSVLTALHVPAQAPATTFAGPGTVVPSPPHSSSGQQSAASNPRTKRRWAFVGLGVAIVAIVVAVIVLRSGGSDAPAESAPPRSVVEAALAPIRVLRQSDANWQPLAGTDDGAQFCEQFGLPSEAFRKSVVYHLDDVNSTGQAQSTQLAEQIRAYRSTADAQKVFANDQTISGQCHSADEQVNGVSFTYQLTDASRDIHVTGRDTAAIHFVYSRTDDPSTVISSGYVVETQIGQTIVMIEGLTTNRTIVDADLVAFVSLVTTIMDYAARKLS